MKHITPIPSLSRPFIIGAAPLDVKTWLDPDQFLIRDLTEKAVHLRERHEVVFRQTPESEIAQAEVRDLIAAHLLAYFPQIYSRDGNIIHTANGPSVDLAHGAPLEAASRLIQEDLCLMRRKADGWHLVAASLCFPSSWSLAEKIGQNMAHIHAPVPGFHGRMHDLVGRMFDAMQVEVPMLRFNWSLYGDDKLHHPETHADPERFPAHTPVIDVAHLRVERQTLRKLPVSGDILFTIRIYTDPLNGLADHPRGAALAASLGQHLAAMTPEQLAYKGLSHMRERLVQGLEDLCQTHSTISTASGEKSSMRGP